MGESEEAVHSLKRRRSCGEEGRAGGQRQRVVILGWRLWCFVGDGGDWRRLP